MIIQDVDQLVCVDESDSFASSMGMTFPTDAGNAQYYEKTGDTVSKVSPSFSDANNKRLIFFPQIFSAIGNQYLTPGSNDIFTFRLNACGTAKCHNETQCNGKESFHHRRVPPVR